MISLGSKLRAKREQLGLSIYEVMKRSNMALNQVKAVEKGNGYTMVTLLKYLEVIDVTKLKFLHNQIEI
jgi:transcriptional regulator with XRE-family HTH domain